MLGWSIMARALAGAAALAIATAAPAQEAPIPRADGYAELERLPDFGGVWTLGVAIMRQPYPIEFLFTPGRVTIFAETYSQARRIYTDGRTLPEDPDFLFNGSSVGRWDGDTLIVDTVGFSPVTEISPGIPHSEAMRIHERIWLESPTSLRIETTITDPEVLAEPFVQQATYRKEPTWNIREYVCEENNRLTDAEGGANIDLDLEYDPEDPFGPPPEE